MIVAGFILLEAMLTVYVLLDGYDLGVAAISPLVAKTAQERADAMRSIGPFWNGNEVWLIAAGGVLFALFPKAYASSFSGFYLPFTLVLWLLMFRGLAMELRNHFATSIWRDFWDVAFSGSSTLLILLFGVTLGNLVRGVPLDSNGYFAGTFGFLLNPYALLVGVLAVATLALHGSLWLAMTTRGDLATRCLRITPSTVAIVAVLYVVATIWTFAMHDLTDVAWWTILLPLISIAGLVGIVAFARASRAGMAFISSSIFLASLLSAAGASIYPFIVPSFPRGGGISAAAALPADARVVIFAVATVGIIAVVAYAIVVRRALGASVSIDR
jgi:cytochrome d ubiquinol oxidase subunit II